MTTEIDLPPLPSCGCGPFTAGLDSEGGGDASGSDR